MNSGRLISAPNMPTPTSMTVSTERVKMRFLNRSSGMQRVGGPRLNEQKRRQQKGPRHE